jgi:hypothetical protein
MNDTPKLDRAGVLALLDELPTLLYHAQMSPAHESLKGINPRLRAARATVAAWRLSGTDCACSRPQGTALPEPDAARELVEAARGILCDGNNAERLATERRLHRALAAFPEPPKESP